MPEESKLVEKLEKQELAKTFSEEEMKEVKGIQSEYIGVQNELGQITINEMRLNEQLENLHKTKDVSKKRFDDLQAKERTFLEGITKKYGEGSLNPETGVFTPNK